MVELADRAARRRISDDLDATLFVEAGAGSGKTRSLVDRIVALVRRGVLMREIAAITFTEKAAAELRDRVRHAFERQLGGPDGELFRVALEQVDGAAISTLHAFAQRILSEHPIEARLPPNVEVLDEVASQIEFEHRWRQFRDRLLNDPLLERTLLLAMATDVTLDDLRHLARVLGDNWDLVADKERLPWDRGEPPTSDASDIAEGIAALLDRLEECRDRGDKLCVHLSEQVAPYLEQLRQAPDEYEVLRLLRQEHPRLVYQRKGSKANWRDHASVLAEMAGIGRRKDALAGTIAVRALQRLALEVADFTLASAEQRRSSGRLEFHDLLVLARELLRDEQHGVDVRRALRRRYRRLLLDEFQDTDPIQIDIAVLIASDDPGAAARPWSDVAVAPGRLFFVGDPKQSIYRFRRADIEVFLQARDTFGDASLSLTTNFRTTPPVIAWINHVFGRLITYEPASQPAYQPLDPAPEREPPLTGPPVTLLGTVHTDEPNAELLREREAEDVAAAVVAALGWKVAEQHDGSDTWRRARLGDITILLPARTSLPALERALEERGVAYRAETSSLVYSTREVRELLATVRALADPTDQLSLVTALRSAAFGCGDDDLTTYKLQYRGAWSLLAPPPDDLPDEHPVGQALRYLRDLRAELPWLAPSEVLDRLVRDRRLFELGYAQGRPRDLWRRLRFVIDQARAWSAAEAGTLRQYVEWARMQASESARVAETILPETDDDSVRIMTVHAAKGLEFPIVILSGMTTASRGARSRVQVAFPPGGPLGLKVGTSLVTPEFEQFAPIDEQMDHHERLRLLYVACTRAKDHLVVSVHRKRRRSEPDEERKYTNAELIARVCVDAPHQQSFETVPQLAPVAAPTPVPEPLSSMEDWEAERVRALRTSGRRRTIGASDLAGTSQGEGERQRAGGWGSEGEGERQRAGGRGSEGEGERVDEEIAAGIDKGPRDLDLPAWQKGRYGTAVGRAVHAVLQTVDLASGAGLVDAAAAQAAAEGVVGREETIVALARAALRAPSVRASLRWRRWRETYVATTIADRTLEGYVDLLYRTDEGLVVVDYKTASSATDLAARVDHYRLQGGAYAVALEAATDEPVARVVFVFLTPEGAVEHELDDLAACRAAVRAALAQR
jgi:ATP-dependent exoDNAse (exonuclease V) beta subunit